MVMKPEEEARRALHGGTSRDGLSTAARTEYDRLLVQVMADNSDLGRFRTGEQEHMHEPDQAGGQFGEVTGCWWAVCVTCGQRIFRRDDPHAMWHLSRTRNESR